MIRKKTSLENLFWLSNIEFSKTILQYLCLLVVELCILPELIWVPSLSHSKVSRALSVVGAVAVQVNWVEAPNLSTTWVWSNVTAARR